MLSFLKGYTVVKPYLHITAAARPEVKPTKEPNERQTEIPRRHRHGG